MEWFIKASAPFKGMKVSTVSEILSIHDYESKTLTKAFAEITGIQVNHELMDEGMLVDKIEVEIAVRQADLRFLDERFRLHRHASALQRHRRRLADRFHGQRRQGHHQSRPRPQRLHRPVVRHIHRRQALPAARSAVRQPLLVPLRLVPEAGAEGGVQEEIRLRARRAGQLVGLRRHRRLLHQRREGDRRPAASTATWTTARRIPRSAGASPTPGCRWPATAIVACRTAGRSTNGASAWRTAFRAAPRSAAAATPTARRRSMRRPSSSNG